MQIEKNDKGSYIITSFYIDSDGTEQPIVSKYIMPDLEECIKDHQYLIKGVKNLKQD